jgi:hypothetical protein
MAAPSAIGARTLPVMAITLQPNLAIGAALVCAKKMRQGDMRKFADRAWPARRRNIAYQSEEK